MVAPLSGVEQWKNDLRVYNEEYAVVETELKENMKYYRKYLNAKLPTTELVVFLIDLTRSLHKLTEIVATAGYNARGINEYRLHLKREDSKENLAENATSTEVFDLYNEAVMYHDIAERRWEATTRLIDAVQSKLNYGPKP